MWWFFSQHWWTGLGAFGSLAAMTLALQSVRQARVQISEGKHALVQPALTLEGGSGTQPNSSTEWSLHLDVLNDGLGVAISVSAGLNASELTDVVAVALEAHTLTAHWLTSPSTKVIRQQERHTLMLTYPSTLMPSSDQAATELPIRFVYADVYGRGYQQEQTVLITASGVYVRPGSPLRLETGSGPQWLRWCRQRSQ